MASATARVVARQVRTLYGVGAAPHLSDGDLLARFASRGDPSAFEALVLRHGPAVLRVCRDVLADPHAADDAFQATFLVLLRRAGFIRKRGSVGPWLHGVAYRVACKARVRAARRRAREKRASESARPEAFSEPDGSSLDRAALHEEIDRLPEPYRAPIVLCYLEGLTHDQAAARLAWPVGTVRGRLARARDRLRDRLRRRGLAPALILAAPRLPALELPARLVRSASEFALRATTHPGTVPAAVAALADGALSAMTWTKARLLGVKLIAVGLLAAGTTTLTAGAGDDPSSKSPPSAVASSKSSDPLDTLITINPPGRMSLGEAIDLIAERTGLTILRDPKDFQAAGLDLSTPLDFGGRVLDAPARTALELILGPVGLTYDKLGNKTIRIWRGEATSAGMVTRVYNVADLVVPHDFGPALGLARKPPRPEFEPLIDLIRSTVAPDSWGDDPTTMGTITPFYLNISLIIRQTPEVHDELVQRLRQLRRLRGLTIPEDEVEETRVPRLDRKITWSTEGSNRKTLGEAIQLIHEKTGLNIIPDHVALAEKGLTLQSAITVPEVTDVQLKTVLKLMLSQVNLSYQLVGDTVVITTPKKVGMTPPASDPPATPAATTSYVFPVADLIRTPGGTAVASAPTRAQVDAMIRLLTASVAPGTWRDFDEEGRPRDTPDPDQVGLIVPSADNSYLRVTHWPDAVDGVRARLDLMRAIGGLESKPAATVLPPRDEAATLKPVRSVTTKHPRQDEYVVSPPDILLVEVLEALPGRPIAGETQVHPDGTITLGSYGNVHVNGLTVREIKEKVVTHLRQYLSDETLGLIGVDQQGNELRIAPADSDRVFVDVAAYNSQVYYVQGDVAAPGRLPITGNETVLDALNNAGLERKDVHVRLVRAGDPPRTLPVDLDAILQGGDTATNHRLQPGDCLIVYSDDRSDPFGGRLDAQDRRLDEIEKKLDRLLETLDAGAPRPDGNPRR
jgi:RNA polymerase sigma factor (sigma-70 family)